MKNEEIELLNKLVENISDRNSAMTRLAESQIPLMEWLSTASINPSGGDQNGNTTKYTMVKEQLDRIDKMLIALNK